MTCSQRRSWLIHSESCGSIMAALDHPLHAPSSRKPRHAAIRDDGGSGLPYESAMSPIDIASIRRAAERLAGRIVRTPLLSSAMLDELAGARVFVKAEPLQRTGSFKLRGALSKILATPE